RAIRRIFTKKLVYRPQEASWLIQSDCALAAQVRLQVRHQESSADAFTRNIGDDESKPVPAQIQEIVIVAADFVRGNANPGVFECFELRESLGKESSLHPFRNFQFLGGAAFGLQLLRSGAPLRFDFANEVIAAHKPKRVSIQIVEAGKNSAP